MPRLRGLGIALLVGAALLAPSAARAAPPPNDAFTAAQELTGAATAAEGLSKDATKEAGEPDHAGEPGGASIWYRWMAPSAGRAVVSTCGSGFDTLLGVYTGDALDALAEVASNDDACGLQSEASFAAVEGVTYRIAVDGVDGDSGTVSLAVRLAPANDDFDDATTLAADSGGVDGTNVGASREADDPSYLYYSVWYRWTAPSTGPATFETCGAPFDTFLAVYTGDEVASLAFVTGNDDACGLASRVHFDATAGVEYRIVVDGYSTGEFRLSWNRNPPPPMPPYGWRYPDITGTPREGETLTATEGDWSGATPMSFAYAWGRCDARYDRCELIEGAVTRTYALSTADIGSYVYVRVTATNVAGSASEYSDPTALIRASGPFNTARPVLTGTARVGETLGSSEGSWSGPTPIQVTYQWQACDGSGSACVDLQGETLTFIELRAAHVDKRLRVIVTGTNPDGSRSVASDASGIVVPATVTKQIRCVVPNVRGKSLKAAKSLIRRGRCRTGRVTRAYSPSVKRGRVISQTPRPGARMKQGTRVKLVVSKGKRG